MSYTTDLQSIINITIYVIRDIGQKWLLGPLQQPKLNVFTILLRNKVTKLQL